MRKIESQSDYSSSAEGAVFKLIKYLGLLTKEFLTVEAGNLKAYYKPPEKVIISDKFFRSAKCQGCGRSCNVGFDLAFTERQINNLNVEAGTNPFCTKLLQNLEKFIVKVNKKEHVFYVYRNPKDVKRCDFAKQEASLWRCKIHEYKPVHCSLPLINISYNKRGKSTFLSKKQYGRNWRFGCPIKFGPFDFYEFSEWDYKVLSRLKGVGDELGLNTYLPNIMKELTNLEPNDLKRIVVYAKKKY